MHKWVRENKGFLAFLLLFGVFRTAIADWNPIPSGSMRPTLLEGDVVFVNRLAFDCHPTGRTEARRRGGVFLSRRWH